MEILGPENGPEGGLCQQLGAVVSVLHVGHTHGGVADPVVDHRVHRHRHAVLRQNLHTKDYKESETSFFFTLKDIISKICKVLLSLLLKI